MNKETAEIVSQEIINELAIVNEFPNIIAPVIKH